jgi:hypothetical protein
LSEQQSFRTRFFYLGSFQFSSGNTNRVTVKTAGITGKFIILDGLWMVDGNIRDVGESGVSVQGDWTASTNSPGYFGSAYHVVL